MNHTCTKAEDKYQSHQVTAFSTWNPLQASDSIAEKNNIVPKLRSKGVSVVEFKIPSVTDCEFPHAESQVTTYFSCLIHGRELER